jgi:hypothetical protein
MVDLMCPLPEKPGLAQSVITCDIVKGRIDLAVAKQQVRKASA